MMTMLPTTKPAADAPLTTTSKNSDSVYPVISLRITEELFRRVDERARREKRTRANMLRLLIERGMDGQDKDLERASRTGDKFLENYKDGD